MNRRCLENASWYVTSTALAQYLNATAAVLRQSVDVPEKPYVHQVLLTFLRIEVQQPVFCREQTSPALLTPEHRTCFLSASNEQVVGGGPCGTFAVGTLLRDDEHSRVTWCDVDSFQSVSAASFSSTAVASPRGYEFE